MSIKWETLKTSDDLLSDYKSSVIPSLNSKRDELISSGILYQGHIFQTRERDIQDMMGALQVAQLSAQQNQPFVTTWLTADNVQVDLDLAGLTGLGVAVAQHKSNLVYKCREHKDAIMLLTSKEEVDQYLNTMTWE